MAGTLSQEGTLTGVEGATGSRDFQLNPYGLLQNLHALNSQDPGNPYFSSRKLAGTIGGDAKAIVKESIVLDATINPDFSQVESDQPQFTVNQRFPVYFPELRPFFLENANYFDTPIDLVYTRNIVHPEFGGRATGKLGRTNIGVLAINDRSPGETVGRDDAVYKKKAFFGIGRISEDVGKNSSVGAIYTDEGAGRELRGGTGQQAADPARRALAQLSEHLSRLQRRISEPGGISGDDGVSPGFKPLQLPVVPEEEPGAELWDRGAVAVRL